jgi:cytosine/adenosine deaminase-related metal-dependent hydrolase
MTDQIRSDTSALVNTRPTDGDIVDIVMRDGVIADIGPDAAMNVPEAHRIPGDGLLVLPGLVDGHAHLDKTLVGVPWMPHQAGPDRMSRIESEKALRASLPPVGERAAKLVEQCIAFGTTAIRTHVDIDPEIGLSHLHALLEVRERFAGKVDIQIVAFPQSGILRAPGTAELLGTALAEGADLLGGIDPIGFDGSLDGQLDVLFDIAGARGVGIDIHLHDAGYDGLREISALAERTQAADLGGDVTVSHGFCLGAAGWDDFARTADAMAKAGISLVTHGAGAMPLPPVKALRNHGVTVFAGNDGVRDPWTPFGSGDMLERAMLLAWRSGFRTDEDLGIAFECCSAAGARVMGLNSDGLEPGLPADLFTVDAETLAEAVANPRRRGVVVKGGRLAAQHGQLV